MNNPILNSMLGQADVVSGAVIEALKQYLPGPQQQQPRKVTSVSGNKTSLRIRK